MRELNSLNLFIFKLIINDDSIAINNRIPSKIKVISNVYKAVTTDWEYCGVSITCPNNHIYLVSGGVNWDYSRPIGVALSTSIDKLSLVSKSEIGNEHSTNRVICTPATLMNTGTFYLWARRISVPTNPDEVYINYIDFVI